MISHSTAYQVFSEDPLLAGHTEVHEVAEWPSDGALADVAAQAGCHETTFLRRCASGVELRWFARRIEVPLCGHGALAAAHHLGESLREGDVVEVLNKRGRLRLSRMHGEAGLIWPELTLEVADVLLPSASFPCTAYAAGRDYLFFTADRDAFRRYAPPTAELQALDRIGVILATTSESADLNFRFFAPSVGIDEDAVSVSVIPALVALAGSVDRKDYCFTQGVDEPVRMEASAHRGDIWVTGRVQPACGCDKSAG